MPIVYEINYTTLPIHMQDGARLYIERGIEGGSFMRAVFENNLVRAFNRADDENLEAMLRWASFLYNEAPRDCWGSIEKVAAWVEHGGIDGLNKANNEGETK